jgi:hypothetical protein
MVVGRSGRTSALLSEHFLLSGLQCLPSIHDVAGELLTYPLQHLKEGFVVCGPDAFQPADRRPTCPRQLAYREVSFLLTGALLAEGDAQDLHDRRANAGTVCPAAYLTRPQLGYCLGQGGSPSLSVVARTTVYSIARPEGNAVKYCSL